VVGLQQGVAISHNILVCCNSLDLAQGEPTLVKVGGNQCSEFLAYYPRTLFAEHSGLGVVLQSCDQRETHDEKLQRSKKSCIILQGSRIIAVVVSLSHERVKMVPFFKRMGNG